MLSDGQRRQVRIETVVGGGINAILSLIVTWLTFGGRASAPWCCSAGSLTFDALPHSFAVAFMATLVPSLLVLSRARKGAIEGCASPQRWPARVRTRILTRAVVIGAVAGAIGLVLHLLAAPAMATELPLATVVAYKAAYGAAVSTVATPIALYRLFVDLNSGFVGSASKR